VGWTLYRLPGSHDNCLLNGSYDRLGKRAGLSRLKLRFIVGFSTYVTVPDYNVNNTEFVGLKACVARARGLLLSSQNSGPLFDYEETIYMSMPSECGTCQST